MIKIDKINLIEVIDSEYEHKAKHKNNYFKFSPTYSSSGAYINVSNSTYSIKDILAAPKRFKLNSEKLDLDANFDYYIDVTHADIKSSIPEPLKEVPKFKTYMIIPGTKFNRNFLAQKIGNAKKVINPKKADIIAGDANSIKNYFGLSYYMPTKLAKYKNESVNWRLALSNGVLDFYKSKTNYISCLDDYTYNKSEKIYKQRKIDKNDYLHKVLRINDLLDKLARPDDIILEDIEFIDLINQVCQSKDLFYLALNSISVYSEKYKANKFFLFLLASFIHEINFLKLSNNAQFYYRIFEIKNIKRYHRYKYNEFEHFLYLLDSHKNKFINRSIKDSTNIADLIKFINNENVIRKLTEHDTLNSFSMQIRVGLK